MYMVKIVCDREGCSTEVKDKRKMSVMRLNPYNKYASFHLCTVCEKLVLTFLRGFMLNILVPGPSGEFEIYPDRDYGKEYWEVLETVATRLKTGVPVWGACPNR